MISTFIWSYFGFLIFTIAKKSRNNMTTSGGYGSNRYVSGTKSLLVKLLGYIYPPMPTLNVISNKNKKLIKDRVLVVLIY